jgi:hypothetical protein
MKGDRSVEASWQVSVVQFNCCCLEHSLSCLLVGSLAVAAGPPVSWCAAART